MCENLLNFYEIQYLECLGNGDLPKIIDYVEDGDLGRFKLENAKILSCGLREQKLDFNDIANGFQQVSQLRFDSLF